VTRRTAAAVLVLCSIAGGLLAGCGESAGEHGAQKAGSSETATTKNGVQQLTIDAGDDLRFQQTNLQAHTGKITITLHVTGDVPHNLILANGPLANTGTGTVSKGSNSITLTFAKPGTYNYLCTIHPKMKGTITIS
jgi:plastocyanin